MKKNFTIMGTGAYGTVLANVLADNGHKVIMYGIDEKQVNDIDINNANSTFFGELQINSNIKATSNLEAALEECEYIVLGVPTMALRSTIESISKILTRKVDFINVAKGFDETTGNLLSITVSKLLEEHNILKSYTGLFGPSIAQEVIERKPTCVMICNTNMKIAEEISDIFNNEYFSAFPTTALIAAEVSAAAKNTLAIAAALYKTITDSDNATASIISKGNSDIFELAVHFGADPKDFMNYATIGDLILTTMSPKSRNYQLGKKIAESDNPKATLEAQTLTVEGVLTCKVMHDIYSKSTIKSKLFDIMYEILYNYKRPSIVMNDILAR
ncbi:NAD(P)H-dependent glycerol-3-phosphate dehydrogenase [Spiroplasma sp. TIUS-1]|uniref:NAD(P)H-dependent glycerol-3-phosphate dehydrogenase n=1 Tax=Spiroplasma sp. TIUS-1 TaxID=216963 RepID=UPI001397131B|nr:NAD(P)H-dependent glycerol-3-phosphate dehydrogenase [Spiroplasma sp. TIUS-1]QHX36012.1 NAD(P)H-dependent glycerol-3-phosphate dehydrogenase [Spiroplasma sp. TIUS-1]